MPSRSVQPAGVPANAGRPNAIETANTMNAAVMLNCFKVLILSISFRSRAACGRTRIISRAGQPEPRDSPARSVSTRFQIERAAMKLGYSAHQEQADTAAVWLGGKKRHEQISRFGRTRTIVDHFDAESTRLLGAADHVLRLRAIRHRIDGVAQQVDHCLLDLIGVQFRRDMRRVDMYRNAGFK